MRRGNVLLAGIKMNIQKRIKIERQLVRHLIRVMKLAGWNAISVNDGGELVPVFGEADTMEAVFAVDESKIYFERRNVRHWVFIVLGNDGWDAIADYSAPENDKSWNDVMDGVSKYADYLCDENYA